MSWPRRRRRCATSPARRGKFGEDQNDDGFIDTRWVELEELYCTVRKSVQVGAAAPDHGAAGAC